jgi:hypothetical protein
MANGEERITINWLFQIVAWVAAAVVAYGMARSDIAVLQAQQSDDRRRMERIELKIDQLLDRMGTR